VHVRQQLRFRFILPVLVVGFTMLLTVWGDAYRQRIIDRVISNDGHLEEPMPQNVALGRFVGYAINAPAYVGAMSMPFIFNARHWHFIHGDKDWWYLILAVSMWYVIGRSLDHLPSEAHRLIRSYTPLLAAVRVLGVAYGIFVCHRALQFYDPPYDYARWFEISVFCWGILIAVWSCRALFQEWTQRKHVLIPASSYGSSEKGA
jgi:hypothetical protein